jgi:hypothetical protein
MKENKEHTRRIKESSHTEEAIAKVLYFTLAFQSCPLSYPKVSDIIFRKI